MRPEEPSPEPGTLPQGPPGRSLPSFTDPTPVHAGSFSRAGKGNARTLRPPGAPLQPEDVRQFLGLDPTSHFDLLELNALPLMELSAEIGLEPPVRRKVRSLAGALFLRVKQELDDLGIAGSLLRELLLRWYWESPSSPEWTLEATARWGGLFADSRSVGGRLQPWLARRLLAISQTPPRSSSFPSPLRWFGPLGRKHRASQALTRPPTQSLAADAAQAVLDDLATHARSSGSHRIALVRLSELAQRRGVRETNEALAALLDGPVGGPFVLLHPNRYPECDLVAIRPPASGASGPALSYALVVQHSTSPVQGALEGGTAVAAGLALPGEGPSSRGIEDGGTEDGTWWDRELDPVAWAAQLARLRAGKQRLDAPPTDYRRRPGYPALRAALASNAEARRGFLAVRWRGRPTGLFLLASLLSEGTFSPGSSTDYEYLDSELNDLERGEPDKTPDPPRWRVGDGVVRREGDFRTGFRYRFEPREMSEKGAPPTNREGSDRP